MGNGTSAVPGIRQSQGLSCFRLVDGENVVRSFCDPFQFDHVFDDVADSFFTDVPCYFFDGYPENFERHFIFEALAVEFVDDIREFLDRTVRHSYTFFVFTSLSKISSSAVQR